MPVCFICKDSIELNVLRSHFRFRHRSHNFVRYECKEENCNRYFHLYNSYRRHLVKNHAIPEGTPVCLSLPSVSSAVETPPFIASGECGIETTPHLDGFEEASQPVIDNSNPVFWPCDTERWLSSNIAYYYANPSFPRSTTQSVVDGFRNYTSACVMPSLNNVLERLLASGEISGEIKNRIESEMTESLCSPFENLQTDYNRINYYAKLGTFIAPEPCRIGERLENVKKNGITRLLSVPCYEYVIPLRKVLKSFFSLQGILSETLNHMGSLYSQEGCITNFIQGAFWRSRIGRNENRVVIPFFAYFDDYETGNVLGSRSGLHKLGAVYVAIPCLPPWRTSVLSNIFLALLFHSSDRTDFGNNVIFQPLIDEFNFLSKTGIEFDVDGYKGTVFFQLGLILGDNLGIHSINGFVESFNGNFPCRSCKVKKEILWTQCREEESLLRNMSNYNDDLAVDNVSLTGVKEKSVWLSVDGFDLFKQVGCDVMHDVLEGVGKYILSFVLNQILFAQQYISLQEFNERVTIFKYGPDSNNKIVPLSQENLVARNIRLSASETLTLTRYLPFLVGDEVPEDDPSWKLYLAYRQLIEFLLSPVLLKDSECYLKTLVEELNELYLEIAEDTLKPKFHHLLHYHRALTQFGPVVHYWSMRFEAKHRLSKLSARVTCNRRNLTLTLATKHQLTLNATLLSGKLPEILVTSSQTDRLSVFEIGFLRRELSLDKLKSLNRITWADLSSIRYKKGTILVLDPVIDGDVDDVVLITVDKLYVYDGNRLIMTGIRFDTVGFVNHLYAYEVRRPKINNSFAFFFDSLPRQNPHTLHLHNGKLYVILRSPL